VAVSIRWTGLGTGLWDWTVGLDSEKVALIVSSQLTEDASFLLQHSCHFGANLRMIVVCNS